MPMTEKRPAPRTIRGWAIEVLQEAGAIRECEEHGWMQDRTDPHARQRAFDIASKHPPAGLSAQAAVPKPSPKFSARLAIPAPSASDDNWDDAALTLFDSYLRGLTPRAP